MPAPGLVSPVTVTGLLPHGPARAGTEVRNKAIEWLKSDDAYADKVLAYPDYFDGRRPGPGPEAHGKVVRSWRQDSPGDAADIVAGDIFPHIHEFHAAAFEGGMVLAAE